MLKHFILILLAIWMASCSPSPASLRPTLATLRHDPSEKFVGHEGVKKLCGSHLGMRYLKQPEFLVDTLKNRTKKDLVDPTAFDADEAKFAAKVRDSYLADSYVKFIDDDFGYGLFANSDIKSGELIGEYTGTLVPSSEVKDHSWSWNYPKDLYKSELGLPNLSLDGKLAGNALRFANHSDSPNSEMRRVFVDGYIRIIYVAIEDIAKDKQIFVSYGAAYWESRKKKVPNP
jgi:hypothetical protein